MSKLVIMLAGINGFLAVSLGAFAAHALRDRLSPELLNTFQTGVQYHMYHALALFGIGLMMINFPASSILRDQCLSNARRPRILLRQPVSA